VRICEFLFWPLLGGAEIHALELADDLRRRGHDVELVALQPTDAPGAETFAGDVQTLEPPIWARGRKLKRLTAARRLIMRGRYDIIHAHSFFPNLYVRAAAAISPRGMPIVATLHSGVDDFAKRVPRIVEKKLASQTAAIVVVSTKQREHYLDHFPERADRIHLIPKGVTKLPLTSRPSSPRPRDFAVIGRIVPLKRIDTAIRGFAAFASHVGDPNLRLHVIGPETDAVYANELRRIAASVPGRPTVIFHGAVWNPFEESNIDVLVHASIIEANPLAILEAAARGIPIVCTRAPTISGAIDDRCTTFAAGEEEGLRGALLDVYTNWPDAIDLAADAWLTVPDITDCATAYERLFLDLVRSNGQAG